MLEEQLEKMSPISLEEMAAVRLMNRIDTKFLTNIDVLKRLLDLSSEDFMVQEVEGLRNSPYFTRYYDTPDANMYYQHQRGKKSRRKVRVRTYLSSKDTLPFLEIKNKNNKGRTKKKRVEMPEGAEIEAFSEFVAKHTEYLVENLEVRLANKFNRITLVNHEKTERITIDTMLEFYNYQNGRKVSLPNLVIIEWKRDGLSSKSKLKDYLRELRIKESGFSKYVIGMALTDDNVPKNKIKPRLRLVNKIMNNGGNTDL